ncbi:MAG TPA: M20 family metallopeptidase [Candidatus Eisenbacteria bacterium]|nr:M20 family metallopeptidase [Candidatus Eisenbacteria bacterium]
MLQQRFRSRTVRRAGLILGLVALAALAPSPPASAPPARPSLDGQIDAAVRARRAALVDIRRDIHRHPEVSGEERRTAALVAKELRRLGLQVRAGVGGQGVVAVLRGGKPGPVVGYRADMDAVPSRDPDPVDFRSNVIGVRHICGHDVHTAVGLGVASGLAAVKRDLPGTAVFYFQPAEETTEGARAMIEAGALSAPTPSALFALHVAPMEVGTIAAIEGLVLPGLDAVTIRLSGAGDLGAAAKEAVALVQGRATPRQGARADSFVTVEIWDQGLPAGDRTVEVSAGIRAANDSIFARVERDLRAKTAALDLPDVKAEVAYRHAVVPPTLNDLATVRATYPALRRALGKEKLEILPNGTRYFSEDFSYFQQRIPGVMYFLGASNEAKKIVAMPHSPGFAVDEAAIEVGARAMARVMADYLARGVKPKR